MVIILIILCIVYITSIVFVYLLFDRTKSMQTSLTSLKGRIEVVNGKVDFAVNNLIK